MIEQITKQGLEALHIRLEELKKKYDENAKALTLAYKNSNGDGAHDNAEFEYLLSQEKIIVSEMNRLSLQIKNAIIIDSVEMDADCVDIDDTIDINMLLTPTTSREMTIQLIGGTVTEVGKQVSINSPMGKAIYGRRIGETVSYETNKNKFNVEILRKVSSKGETSD